VIEVQDHVPMLPFILWLRELLPAGSADWSLFLLILNVHVNIVAVTVLIPRISALVSIEHVPRSLVGVWVARIGGVGEGARLTSKRDKNLGRISFLHRQCREMWFYYLVGDVGTGGGGN
jgi:hypothetical protein